MDQAQTARPAPSAHHLVQTLSPGDAISGHALGLARLLRRWGWRSTVYAERLHPRALGLGLPVSQLEPGGNAEDLLFYHYSLDSELTGLFERFPGRRVLVYHNVTPERFLVGFHAELVELLARGREALARLRGVPHWSLADSDWNRKELEDLGFTPTATLPVLANLSRLEATPDPLTVHRIAQTRGTRVLFVGRVIPNKGHHALLLAFAAYQRLFDPQARLWVVGEFRSIESYNHELLRLAERTRVRNVEFLGHVSDAALAACYRAADLFVCLSRHEGFCVPLLEAFAAGVPVLALDRTAVTDTCGDAAVLTCSDDPLLVAGLMDRIHRDPALRRGIVERQRRRLEDFSEARIAATFASLLEKIRR